MGRLDAWIDDSSLPNFLDRNELVGLGVLRGLLSSSLPDSRSNWLPAGRHNELERAASSARSLLSCELNAAKGVTRLRSSALHPGGPAEDDWVLDVSESGRNQVTVTVSSYRTSDNGIVNADVLVALRDQVLQSLATGLNLVTVDGPPNLDDLRSLSPAAELSGTLGEHDYLLPIPKDVGRRLSVGLEHFESVRNYMDETQVVRSARPVDGAARSLGLSGGRRLIAGTLDLRRDEQDAWLQIELPTTLGKEDAQRSYRAALCILQDMVFVLTKVDAALGARITALKQTVLPTDVKDRSTWVAAHGDQAAVWRPPIRLRCWYPIAVVVRTPESRRFVVDMHEASSWCLQMQRTWTSGLRQKAKDQNRTFLSRRPSVLSQGGNLTSYLRYGPHSDMRLETLGSTSAQQSWFWEANCRVEGGADQGGFVATLVANGVSRSVDELMYGGELFSLMGAWADIATRHPDATISTVYLGI